jgi:hypothetical protein
VDTEPVAWTSVSAAWAAGPASGACASAIAAPAVDTEPVAWTSVSAAWAPGPASGACASAIAAPVLSACKFRIVSGASGTT